MNYSCTAVSRQTPLAVAAAVACLASLGAGAHAQTAQGLPATANPETGRALQLRVGAGLEHDSNVLRTPGGASDTILSGSVGARFDKQYSLQRITLDVEAAAFKFSDISALDYSTLNYTAAWNFALTPRLRGLAQATRRQYRDLTDTGVIGAPRVDRRTDTGEVLEATYGVGGPWQLSAGVTHTQNRSDEPRALESGSDITSARIGAGREFPSGASVMLRLRQGEGSYDTFLGGQNFRETEPEVVVKVPLTGRTTVDARLGYLDRTHDNASALNFSGVVGAVNAGWQATGKTRVDAGIARELGSYQFGGGGSVSGTRIHITPTWRATEKITVKARYEREERDWRVVNPALSPDAGREDVSHFASTGVDWEPVRNVLVSAGLRHERRNSSLPAFSYRANVVSLGAKYTF